VARCQRCILSGSRQQALRGVMATLRKTPLHRYPHTHSHTWTHSFAHMHAHVQTSTHTQRHALDVMGDEGCILKWLREAAKVPETRVRTVQESVEETSDGAVEETSDGATTLLETSHPSAELPPSFTGKHGGMSAGEDHGRQAAAAGAESEEHGVDLMHNLALASADAFESSFTNYVQGYIGCLGACV